jgi:hypothetical protein
MMMEAARTSETLVNFFQTTRRYNPEVSHHRQTHGFFFNEYLSVSIPPALHVPVRIT